MGIKLRDEVLSYPNPESSGYPLRDYCFNWVVARYKRNNHPWKQSDNVIFRGFFYNVVDYISLLLYLAFFWWLITATQRHFGDFKAIMVALAFIIIRLNLIARNLNKLNKKFY